MDAKMMGKMMKRRTAGAKSFARRSNKVVYDTDICVIKM
jgi:hypothetical protein